MRYSGCDYCGSSDYPCMCVESNACGGITVYQYETEKFKDDSEAMRKRETRLVTLIAYLALSHNLSKTGRDFTHFCQIPVDDLDSQVKEITDEFGRRQRAAKEAEHRALLKKIDDERKAVEHDDAAIASRLKGKQERLSRIAALEQQAQQQHPSREPKP